jgi:hypothetical protein
VTTVTADRLNRDAQEFLRFKRAMGIAYWRGEFVLNSFVRFVAQRWGDHGEVALDDAVTRWCARIAGRKQRPQSAAVGALFERGRITSEARVMTAQQLLLKGGRAVCPDRSGMMFGDGMAGIAFA